MSPRNWRVCPKCQKIALLAIEAEQQKLAEQYGKIPAEAFVAKTTALKKAKADAADMEEQTLRENYSFEFIGGTFRMQYSVDCDKCDFLFKKSFGVDHVY
jgi:hypothetical protein